MASAITHHFESIYKMYSKFYRKYDIINTFALLPEISRVNRHNSKIYCQPILVAMATSLTTVTRN